MQNRALPSTTRNAARHWAFRFTLMRSLMLVLTLVLTLGPIAAALAQVPPAASEVAAYKGLHAAAHQGDIAALQAAAVDKAALHTRDAAAVRGYLAMVQKLLAAGAE